MSERRAKQLLDLLRDAFWRTIAVADALDAGDVLEARELVAGLEQDLARELRPPRELAA